MTIHLSDHEKALVYFIARGRADGVDPPVDIEAEVLDVLGEYVLARFLRLFFPLHWRSSATELHIFETTFGRVHSVARPSPRASLVFEDDVPSNASIALVRPTAGDFRLDWADGPNFSVEDWEVVGWVHGSEAKADRFILKRKPELAWRVPDDRLRDPFVMQAKFRSLERELPF